MSLDFDWKCKDLQRFKTKNKNEYSFPEIKKNSVSVQVIPSFKNKFKDLKKSFDCVYFTEKTRKIVTVDDASPKKRLKPLKSVYEKPTVLLNNGSQACVELSFHKNILAQFSAFYVLNRLKNEYNFDFQI